MEGNKLTIFKLNHRDEFWIGIRNFTPLNSWKKIRSLSISHYSKSHSCWYIPYTKEAFKIFQDLNIPYTSLSKIGTIGKLSPNDVPTDIGEDSPKSAIPKVRKFKKDADIIGYKSNEKFKIRWTNKSYFLKLPYKKQDVAFIKSLTSSFWDPKLKLWIIKSTIINTKMLQEYFGFWNKTELAKILMLISTSENPKVVTFFTSPEYHQNCS